MLRPFSMLIECLLILICGRNKGGGRGRLGSVIPSSGDRYCLAPGVVGIVLRLGWISARASTASAIRDQRTQQSCRKQAQIIESNLRRCRRIPSSTSRANARPLYSAPSLVAMVPWKGQSTPGWGRCLRSAWQCCLLCPRRALRIGWRCMSACRSLPQGQSYPQVNLILRA